MRTTIDKAGRVIIPKALRDKAALRANAEVEVRYDNGRIVVEPAAGNLRIVKRGATFVAVCDDRLPKMTTEDVEEIRRAIRRERSGVEE